MMNLIKSVLVFSLCILSFASQAAQVPSEVVLGGVSYAVNPEVSAVVANQSLSIDLTKEESQQVEKQGLAAASALDFKCRFYTKKTVYFTNVRPNDLQLVYSFNQTCANKFITAKMTNLSNGSLALYLTDSTGNQIVAGPTSWVSEQLPVGTYHLFVVNSSSSQRGDGYVDTEIAF
ncbi:hypothetical protein VR7878_01580 [Vibrio ruber DSM 16370]|uniref:Uncharacterized protein n=1 Tax=Vibrio ruber (strain DSM 16370 / JCM 11486 / BCRC 17186 / CECT 7878 / LMG 23124 / VR1) TaxID=1123498 RepID=A0A1R4LHT7_VIBR1|nr:hypothetical protein [Vibrio ruber]SJN56065.1 hypothetical protein VR7878_01580 [Vibrio ruber DSM 16370]